MEPDTDVKRAFGRFVELAGGMAAGGHYEATYHALMAAVHCAEDAGDTARLTEVARLLRQHKHAIDTLVPPHKLATLSTQGGRSIFEMGAVMAETVIKRLENQQRIDELRHGR
jgi:hypothetical protein